MTDLKLIIGPRLPAFNQPPLTDIAHLDVPWQLTVSGVTVTLVWRNDDPPTLQIGIEPTDNMPTEPPER